MKKIDIIKSSREYTEIINLGNSKKSKYFSIYYRKNNKDNRYGITVTKKTDTAVGRNKIKRRAKNIIDNNKNTIQNGYDYVIIVRKGILELTYKDMEKELLNKEIENMHQDLEIKTLKVRLSSLKLKFNIFKKIFKHKK